MAFKGFVCPIRGLIKRLNALPGPPGSDKALNAFRGPLYLTKRLNNYPDPPGAGKAFKRLFGTCWA